MHPGCQYMWGKCYGDQFQRKRYQFHWFLEPVPIKVVEPLNIWERIIDKVLKYVIKQCSIRCIPWAPTTAPPCLFSISWTRQLLWYCYTQLSTACVSTRATASQVRSISCMWPWEPQRNLHLKNCGNIGSYTIHAECPIEDDEIHASSARPAMKILSGMQHGLKPPWNCEWPWFQQSVNQLLVPEKGIGEVSHTSSATRRRIPSVMIRPTKKLGIHISWQPGCMYWYWGSYTWSLFCCS